MSLKYYLEAVHKTPGRIRRFLLGMDNLAKGDHINEKFQTKAIEKTIQLLNSLKVLDVRLTDRSNLKDIFYPYFGISFRASMDMLHKIDKTLRLQMNDWITSYTDEENKRTVYPD